MLKGIIYQPYASEAVSRPLQRVVFAQDAPPPHLHVHSSGISPEITEHLHKQPMIWYNSNDN